jgi:hypothetical protein
VECASFFMRKHGKKKTCSSPVQGASRPSVEHAVLPSRNFLELLIGLPLVYGVILLGTDRLLL